MSESRQNLRDLDHWLNLSIICIVFAALFSGFAKTEADSDLWGHVKYGQDLLLSGKVATVDPYSYVTAGSKWINHEWLAEALFGYSYNQWGASGLVALKLLVAMGIIAILYNLFLRAGFNAMRAGFVIVVTMQMLGPGLVTVRPHLFTYLFFLLTLLVIQQADKKNYKYLLCLPPIFVLWVNAHGGFLAGLAVVSAWSVFHIVSLIAARANDYKKDIACVIGGLLLTGLATLANPYGFELLTFLAKTATVARPEIDEWTPISITSFLGVVYLASVLIAGVSLIYGDKKPSKSIMFLWALLTLAPLVAYRHLPLFALATAVFTGPSIAAWWQKHSRIKWSDEFAKYSPAMKRLLACLFLLGSVYLLNRCASSFGRLAVPDYFPVAVVELLKNANVKGNIANEFDSGEYILFHLGPRVKVSLDGRRETIYSTEVYKENFAMRYGVGDWDALLKKYPTDMVLAGNGFATLNLMKLKPDWLLVYQDLNGALFVKKDFAYAQALKAAKRPDPPQPWYFP